MTSFIHAISDTRAIRDLLRGARRCAAFSIVAMMAGAGALLTSESPRYALTLVFTFFGVLAELEAIPVIRAINTIFKVERRAEARAIAEGTPAAQSEPACPANRGDA